MLCFSLSHSLIFSPSLCCFICVSPCLCSWLWSATRNAPETEAHNYYAPQPCRKYHTNCQHGTELLPVGLLGGFAARCQGIARVARHWNQGGPAIPPTTWPWEHEAWPQNPLSGPTLVKGNLNIEDSLISCISTAAAGRTTAISLGKPNEKP